MRLQKIDRLRIENLPKFFNRINIKKRTSPDRRREHLQQDTCYPPGPIELGGRSLQKESELFF